jgi:uncharacterized membrane protein
MKSNRNTKTTIWVCLMVSAACSSGSAQLYNLGPGNFVSGVSYDGMVAAGTGPSQYFTWTAAGGIDLIGGTIPGNGVGGQAKISNDGTRISGTTLNTVSNQFEMSYYDTTTGSWNPLGGIGNICPGGPGDETSSGWGISGDGTSVVGLGWFGFCGPAHAVQWKQSTGMTADLGSTVAGRSSRANGTNFDGTVVVGWQDAMDGFRQAAVWNNGVQTVLSTGPMSEANDVDANGVWVVGNGPAGEQAWRWSSATGVLPLGSLIGERGFATGISDDGTVIVGFERGFGPFGAQAGFIWTEATGIMSLNDFVDLNGIDRQGLNLALPLTISGDGRTIAGSTGTLGGVGFVVTVPEPGFAFMLPAIVWLWRCRRRRWDTAAC